MLKTSSTSKVSSHVEKRSQTMKVERLSPTEFRVTPSEKGRPVRRVEFFMAGYEDEANSRIDCFAEGSLISCPSNIRGRLCSHAFAAIKALLAES